MDKKKKAIVLKVVIVVLLMTNTFLMYQSSKEKKVINNYLDKYYMQLTFKEDTKLELQEEINDGLIVIEGKNEENAKDLNHYSVYQNQYDEFITEKLKAELVERNMLPNFALIDFGIENDVENFKIDNMKFRKKDKNMYEARYDLLLNDNNKNKKMVSYDEIFVIKKDNDKLKIDYIGTSLG